MSSLPELITEPGAHVLAAVVIGQALRRAAAFFSVVFFAALVVFVAFFAAAAVFVVFLATAFFVEPWLLDLPSAGAGETPIVAIAPAIGSAARAFGKVADELPVKIVSW